MSNKKKDTIVEGSINFDEQNFFHVFCENEYLSGKAEDGSKRQLSIIFSLLWSLFTFGSSNSGVIVSIAKKNSICQ